MKLWNPFKRKESKAEQLPDPLRLRIKLEVYRDRGKRWRWRLRAVTGDIVADSGQGYANKGDCIDMVERIVNNPDVYEKDV
jgi:uncharacterized protein YegP (UPF0339 family)